MVEQGYSVANVDYPSRHFTAEVLADVAVAQGLAACEAMAASTVHFVAHSMGNILIRQYLQNHEIGALGRIVMLAPPNHGSEVTDAFRNLAPYEWLNGPAGLQLGTEPGSLPNRLGPIAADVAVIAGTRSINLILSQFLPNPDDGKVSVASAQLDGMCAMLALPVSHPFIMQDDEVIDEVLAYLATGRFAADGAEYPECGR